MRLIRDTSRNAARVQVFCVGRDHERLAKGSVTPYWTSRMFTLADGYSDADGVPYFSHYCRACARALGAP